MDRNKLSSVVSPSLCSSPHCSAFHLCDAVSPSALCPLELSYSLTCFTNGSLICLLLESWLTLGTCFSCSPLKRMVLLLPYFMDLSVAANSSFRPLFLSGQSPLWSCHLFQSLSPSSLLSLLTRICWQFRYLLTVIQLGLNPAAILIVSIVCVDSSWSPAAWGSFTSSDPVTCASLHFYDPHQWPQYRAFPYPDIWRLTFSPHFHRSLESTE